MPIYDLINEYPGGNTEGIVTTNPAWVLCVVRYKHPVTYSRKNRKARTDLSSKDMGQTEAQPLVIYSDCIQMTVQHSKGSYISSLSAQLLHTKTDYLKTILPGDWVFAWMVNSTEKAKSLIKRIKEGQDCNQYDSGLKFIGRVSSLRKRMHVDKQGHRQVRYELQGNGFREFDSMIYYDPNLGQNAEGNFGKYLSQLGLSINSFFVKAKGASVNKLIPLVIDKILGRGISGGFHKHSVPTNMQDNGKKRVAYLRTGAGAESTAESPYAYVVPKQVTQLLDKSEPSSPAGVASYADMLNIVMGVQKYKSAQLDKLADIIKRFQPEGTQDDTERVRETGKPMQGFFVPATVQFTNMNAWSLCQQFLNPAVNEMYACLRVNGEGKIMPTIVARQLPFSTPSIQEHYKKLPFTQFTELPRWKLHPNLVFQHDVGRSESMRINYFEVMPHSTTMEANGQPARVRALNQATLDEHDIKRHGIKIDSQTLYCAPEYAEQAKVWSNIRADFLAGGQLYLSGTFSTIGIEAPICIGDNIEYESVIYHIESITHTCGMIGSNKQFVTSITASFGTEATPFDWDDDDARYVDLESHRGSATLSEQEPGLSVEDSE